HRRGQHHVPQSLAGALRDRRLRHPAQHPAQPHPAQPGRTRAPAAAAPPGVARMNTLASPPAVAVAPAYTTHPGDPERDRDAILAIWGDHFGPLATQPAKYDHFYLRNPHGRPLLQLLRHGPDGEQDGVIGAGPRPLVWRGRSQRAAVFAHFAVAAEHRSLGPALQLQQALVEAARGRFDLLYGLPRATALGVTRRAGFSVLGELARHARVLRHGDYLR